MPAFGKLVTALTVCTLCLSPPVIAQDKDAGKELVKGLLRALVESQLEREQGRSELAPPPPPGPPGQPTPEITQLRPLLAAYVQELTTLTALLNTDARRSFAVRGPLADALQLQATAAAVKQRADSERHHRGLLQALMSLNAQWKTLVYQLQTLPGISNQTRASLTRVDQLNSQYCQLLNIQEQFDGREVIRAVDALAAELRVLADEISYASTTSGNRLRTAASLRRLQERAVLLGNLMADQAPPTAVVSEYQSLFQAWQQLRPELAGYTGRSVVRAVGRIQETHRTIHELLRLNFGIDQALLQQMAVGLQRDLSELFRTITLEQMMVLRDHRAIAQAADALAGSAENLTDVVTRQESPAAVGEAWFYLDEAWRLFAYYMEPLRAPETRRRLDGLAQSVDALRVTIGVSVAFDQTLVSQQAATLHGLADRLQAAVGEWARRPGSGVERTTLQQTDQLEALCHQLETLTASSRNLSASQSRCDEVIVLWQQLRPRLLTCTTQERATLESLADSLTSALVRLKTMLGD